MRKQARFRLDFGRLKGLVNPGNIAREYASTFRQLMKTDPNIVVFVVYGLIYDMVLNLYKPFALKFLDRVGGTEFHISLFNSLPGLAAVVAIIPGSLLINRFRRKKPVTTVFFAFSRAFILMLVFVPFLPLYSQPIVFVLLVSAMNFFDAVGQNSFQGLIGQAFNGFTRARAISLRNKFGNVSVMVITLVTGLIITLVPKTNEQRVHIYQIFFAVSFAASILELFVFGKFREPKREAAEAPQSEGKPPEKTERVNPLRDARFLGFLLPSLFFYFTWHMGWPLGGILQVKTLRANEMWLAAIAVASGLAGVTFASRWGRYINKRGNWTALTLAAFLLAFNMFFNAVSFNLYVLLVTAMFGGGVSIGASIALFNGLLAATPDRNRVVYIGIYNTLVNVSLAVAPFVSLFFINITGVRPANVIVGVCRLIACAALFYAGKRAAAGAGVGAEASETAEAATASKERPA